MDSCRTPLCLSISLQKRALKNWSIRHMLLFGSRAANRVYSKNRATQQPILDRLQHKHGHEGL